MAQTEQTTAGPHQPEAVAEIEAHSIDIIPESERHGRVGGQFLLWFATNANVFNFVLGGFAIPLQTVVAAFPQLGPWAGWRLGTDPHLRQHWRPRARGVYQDTTPGWYFTGRTALLRELTGWLERGSPGRAVRVVTGPAGTGKSAVLAWLCALSDPQLRGEIAAARPAALTDTAAVPAAGLVSAAVWARGRDGHDDDPPRD